MRFIYTTDLHGSSVRYDAILKAALKEKVGTIVNGGDMLPYGRGAIIARQRTFVHGFLKDYFAKCAEKGIKNLFILGNDDVACVDNEVDALCVANSMAVNLNGRVVELDGLHFIGFNLVTDYPFMLKDRCRADDRNFVLQPQLGPGMLSQPDGTFWLVPDWPKQIWKLPTLEDELANLPKAPAAKTIYVIHMPPDGLGLDVCWDGRQVGSKAVRRFLEASRAMFSFHGHIHESCRQSKCFRGDLGSTICVQPGQENGGYTTMLVYVVVDTETKEIVRRGQLMI